MVGPDLSRLRKEIEKFPKEFENSGVHAEFVGDNLTHIAAKIKGPKDTPYENGIFHIDIKIPDAYPFEPPKMKFTTKIWHPNISSETGAICLDILKDAWTPALTLRTALLGLQALLSTPEPTDPQDAVVAREYLSNYKKWTETAKFWTDTYARNKGTPAGSVQAVPKDPKVEQLIAMGFEEAAAVRALKEKNGNVEEAIELLFS